MLAVLFLLGASIAAGAMVGFEMDGGDDEAENYEGQSDHAEIEANAEEGARGAAPGLETLVSEAPSVVSQVSDAPGVPEVPAVTTLLSETTEVETMIGETAGEWLGVDVEEEASDLWSAEAGAGEAVTEGTLDPPEDALDLGAAENPEAETIVDADGGDAGGEVHDWKGSDDPVVIEEFDPEVDLLQVTLFTPPGADGVDVELGTSEDGQDGEIRANDRLVAIVKGNPDLNPETLVFDLQDSPDADAGEGSDGSEKGSEQVASDQDDDHRGRGRGHAYGRDGHDGDDHPGRGHAYGHDNHEDGHDRGRGKGKGRG